MDPRYREPTIEDDEEEENVARTQNDYGLGLYRMIWNFIEEVIEEVRRSNPSSSPQGSSSSGSSSPSSSRAGYSATKLRSDATTTTAVTTSSRNRSSIYRHGQKPTETSRKKQPSGKRESPPRRTTSTRTFLHPHGPGLISIPHPDSDTNAESNSSLNKRLIDILQGNIPTAEGMSNMQNAGLHLPRRGGMQVHAVPESERAVDANGVRLPWGYEYADPDHTNQRRAPEERGPFGKSTSRRGSSRQKTVTPSAASKEDRANELNWKQMDEIFLTPRRGDKSSQPTQAAATAPGSLPATAKGVPTELILYGFPEAFQWAAIDFYERISGGVIYEDYDRTPPNPRYNMSLSRSVTSRKTAVPAEALAKVNSYHGGNSWIKVTFDSAEAAERACYFSPHKLHGYIVYAEAYRGTGPHKDEPIPATTENMSQTASPQPSNNTSNTATIPAAASSATASSATPLPNDPVPKTPTASFSSSVTVNGNNAPTSALRIRGARKLQLLPAEKAVLPSSSLWYRTFGELPIIGWLFSGPGDMIGNEMPLTDNGEFDWDRATIYWRFWAVLDYYLWFANFLGIKD